MFTFDTTSDPFLRMSLTGTVTEDDERSYLEALKQLSERQSPFGLISIIDIESGEVTHETRRAQNMWFKENRAHLAEVCFGLVRVRPKIDPEESDEAFIRAMPFPTRRVAREEDVLPILRDWLELYDNKRGQA
ncbi:hypothetical protein [Denitrobaculum tricleocarpae]|uniref:Uncharacterized protein n=1 Tax=Denitrobaculum tricleocarpae TaxID=2591009 RepID=A0A545TG04_9PROT|nr:hypothetical protein [Denitrobaculum tricleocarpae]TQV76128.1 hypothetical protein FKG95_21015 [Denitrobaculum tricleocarpae]